MTGEYITLETAQKMHDIKQENIKLKKTLDDIEMFVIKRIEFCKKNEINSMNYEDVLREIKEIRGVK